MNFAEFGQRDDWQLFRRRRGLRCVDGASKRARVDGGDGLVREAVGQRFALFAPSRRQAGIELPCDQFLMVRFALTVASEKYRCQLGFRMQFTQPFWCPY